MKDIDKYLDRVKEQLECNATEEYKNNYITYLYSNEEVDNNLYYFNKCRENELSEYKALLMFIDYLDAIHKCESLLKRVESFSELEYGWDGYNGEKISNISILNAQSLLKYISYSNDINTVGVYPMPCGGIQIEIGDYIEIEIRYEHITEYYYDKEYNVIDKVEYIMTGKNKYKKTVKAIYADTFDELNVNSIGLNHDRCEHLYRGLVSELPEKYINFSNENKYVLIYND